MKDDELFTKTGCLSSGTFESVRNDELSDIQWGLINNHIENCVMCSDALDGISAADNYLEITNSLRRDINLQTSKQSAGRRENNIKVYISIAASFIIIVGISILINSRIDDSIAILNNSDHSGLNVDFLRPSPGVDGNNFTQINDNLQKVNSGFKIFSPGAIETKDLFSDQVFKFTEEMPEFPGGILGLDEFIRDEVRKAEEKYNVRSCGKVTVEFLIDKNGQVENPIVVSGGSKLLNDIAVSIIKKLPAWRPGYQSGEAVAVSFSLPVRFEKC